MSRRSGTCCGAAGCPQPRGRAFGQVRRHRREPRGRRGLGSARSSSACRRSASARFSSGHSAFSFVASATAALGLGARPVFVDVEPATLALDPDRVADAIAAHPRDPRRSPLRPPAAMGPLRVLAEARGVHLVEDAAQAFGATLGGRPVGGHGRAAASDEEPRGLRGRRARDDHRRGFRRAPRAPGTTDRRRNTGTMSRVGRAVGNRQPSYGELRHLRVDPGATSHRRAVQRGAGRASRRPPRGLRAPPVFHRYTIRTPRRDALAARLAAASIGTACPQPSPFPSALCPLPFALFPRHACCDAAAREVLSLPCFPELRSDEVDAVIAAVRGFFEGDH